MRSVRTSSPAIATSQCVLVAHGTNNQMFSWQAGIDAFLVRPFHADELLRHVAEAIARPDAERPRHRRKQLDEANAAKATHRQRGTQASDHHPAKLGGHQGAVSPEVRLRDLGSAGWRSLIYLLWGDDEPAAGDALRDRLLGDVAPALLDAGALRLGMNVHDTAAAEAPSPVPTPAGEPPHVAEISVWVDCYTTVGLRSSRPSAALGLRSAGYLVLESLYDDYGTTEHSPPRTGPTASARPACSPWR